MGELWLPDETGQIPLITASSAPATASYSANDEHKARTPPPDLPSLLLDSRIVFLGMPVGDYPLLPSIRKPRICQVYHQASSPFPA